MHTRFSVCIFLPMKKTLDGFCFELGRALSIDAYKLSSLTLVLKLHVPLDKSEQRIILSATDIITRFPFGAPLASQDVSTEYVLAAEFFEAKPLSVRVAAISR